MKKIYLTNHQNKDRLLKKLFPVALCSKGLGFIEDIPLNGSVEVKGSTKEKAPELNELCIEALNQISNLREVVLVNLEQDIEGISTKHRTPEAAVLFLQEFETTFRLQVWLVELKTTLTNRSLDYIEAKFRCAMNRMYMLMNFFDYSVHGRSKNIYLTFKGLVLYNQDNTKAEDDAALYHILENYKEGTIKHKRDITLRCDTLLSENDKIQIKFVQNTGDNIHRFALPLAELIKSPL